MTLWDRQRDDADELEPLLWFSRFTLYRKIGVGRSLLGAANANKVKEGQKKSNYTPGSWRLAFDKWNWKARAEAYDTAELERQAVEFREDCDEWRRERFADARTLREKARALLRFPVTRRTGADEKGAPYIVEAVSSSTLKDAAGILKTADELARITTRETLPKVEMQHSGQVTSILRVAGFDDV